MDLARCSLSTIYPFSPKPTVFTTIKDRSNSEHSPKLSSQSHFSLFVSFAIRQLCAPLVPSPITPNTFHPTFSSLRLDNSQSLTH